MPNDLFKRTRETKEVLLNLESSPTFLLDLVWESDSTKDHAGRSL